VTALVAASALRTCLGDGEQTFGALLGAASGIGAIRYVDGAKLNVDRGYHVREDGEERLFRASRWLGDCLREALAQTRIDAKRQRVAVIVGTGLRELRAVERAAVTSETFATERLHFASAVREVAPDVAEVVTLSNACSAGGHALALAQDLVELGEADVAVAAATDSMTESMLAMIGRVTDAPTPALRPFDAGRTGTLLGEGAAAVVVVPEGACERPLARLLSTGLSCDAYHSTAADVDGIRRATTDAFARAGRTVDDVDLVVAHGTGTALNDPLEARLICEAFADRNPAPLVTAVKGAVGHTSGTAALVNFDVALRCLASGFVPPIVGLEQVLEEGAGVRFVIGEPVAARVRLAQVNAFGFGGTNAVTLVEAVA
jgi:3-oxoacyl-[acyl-carrier-protein] synthase II